MPFIPVDKMKQLREAAKNGDERARKILQAQLKKEDYTSDLDAYFAPAPAATKVIENGANPGSATEAKATQGTGNAKLDQFLLDNGVSEGDPEYEDAINDYYNEFPEERPAEEPKSAPEQTHVLFDQMQQAFETTKNTIASLQTTAKEVQKSVADTMKQTQQAASETVKNATKAAKK